MKTKKIKVIGIMIHIIMWKKGDKLLTSCIVFADTPEQAVGIVQKEYPDKNFTFNDIIQWKIVNASEAQEIINTPIKKS